MILAAENRHMILIYIIKTLGLGTVRLDTVGVSSLHPRKKTLATAITNYAKADITNLKKQIPRPGP